MPCLRLLCVPCSLTHDGCDGHGYNHYSLVGTGHRYWPQGRIVQAGREATTAAEGKGKAKGKGWVDAGRRGCGNRTTRMNVDRSSSGMGAH